MEVFLEIPWSQVIELWLPGGEHDPDDYDIPCSWDYDSERECISSAGLVGHC